MCQASRPCELREALTTIAIICVPVAKLSDPAPGSTEVPCLQCGTACWLAPETVFRKAGKPDAVFEHYCMPCALASGDEAREAVRDHYEHEEN